MSPVVSIVALWAAFAVTHMTMSSIALRPRLVGSLGERAFQGVYSLVALALFVPLCAIYLGHRHEGPALWHVTLTPALLWGIQIAMGVAFVLLFAGVLTPSPISIGASPGPGPMQPRGVHFITRHAVFMALGLFGAVHLIPNGYASDVAFFGGFVVFVVVGSMHQDRRKLATDPERYGPFVAQTALLPFTGPHTLRGLRELSRLAIVLGIVTTVVVRTFHPVWFGGFGR